MLVGRSFIFMQQTFGISVSIVIAASIWLSITTVSYCFHEGEGIESISCKSEGLITFLVNHRAWPYHHIPFVGYFDSYDNKLASVLYEPYSQLATAAAISYLVWLWIALQIKKRERVAAAKGTGRETRYY